LYNEARQEGYSSSYANIIISSLVVSRRLRVVGVRLNALGIGMLCL